MEADLVREVTDLTRFIVLKKPSTQKSTPINLWLSAGVRENLVDQVHVVVVS